MIDVFSLIDRFKKLRKQKPLLAAVIMTMILWIVLAAMWPAYRPGVRDTLALLVVMLILTYFIAWVIGLFRRRGGDGGAGTKYGKRE